VALNAIPVERPQDIAKNGVGTVNLTSKSLVVTGAW
jgi:hypothetical protein